MSWPWRSLLPERHAEVAEEGLRLLVRPRGGHDDDVHAPGLVDLVVDDLREDQLLAEAEGIVATAVERLGGNALEVPHARQGDVDEAVEELVHAGGPQPDLGPDGHALAQLE